MVQGYTVLVNHTMLYMSASVPLPAIAEANLETRLLQQVKRAQFEQEQGPRCNISQGKRAEIVCPKTGTHSQCVALRVSTMVIRSTAHA